MKMPNERAKPGDYVVLTSPIPGTKNLCNETLWAGVEGAIRRFRRLLLLGSRCVYVHRKTRVGWQVVAACDPHGIKV